MAVGSRIKMPNTPNPGIGDSHSYFTRRGRPVLFQVVDPTNQPLFPFLLALHINPRSFNESFTKSKNVVMTYGGFVEFVWPDELDIISAQATTGAFFGPTTGLTSGSDGVGNNFFGKDSRIGATGRHGTMAWERQEDLLDLFRNNGAIYNGLGQPVIRGRVMCIYDRGVYIGHFGRFSVKEDDSHAYSFELDWEFKVESSIYTFAGASNQIRGGDGSSKQTQAQAEAEILEEPTIDTGVGIEDRVAPPPPPEKREDETLDEFLMRLRLYRSAFNIPPATEDDIF